jgi:type II secretory pathway pseudopilin PulG
MTPNRIQTLRRPLRAARRRAFSLTELIVVIGIIALLVGLLLVALGVVRDKARGAATEATLNSFIQACQAYQIEHGQYPGVVPEFVLAEANTVGQQPEFLTTTENAVLALMGGYRVLPPNASQVETDEFDTYGDCDGSFDIVCFEWPSGWQLKVNLARVGEGPYIFGKQYGAYFDPSAKEMSITLGQVGDHRETDGDGNVARIAGVPDLLDAWGQPIVFARRLRPAGPFLGEAATGNQFTTVGWDAYLSSRELGALGYDQFYDEGDNPSGSIFSSGAPQRIDNLFRLLEHPALAGTPRGQIFAISAGPDGIFFSAGDGPGSKTAPISEIGDPTIYPPRVVDEYDDVYVTAGG